MSNNRRMHDRYWRGVRRQARKETREALFGSTEKFVRDLIGWAIWIVFIVLLVEPEGRREEMIVGFASAAPALLYPAVYWYKRAFIPPRLRVRATKRLATLRARLAAQQTSTEGKRLIRTRLGEFLQRGSALMERCRKMSIIDLPWDETTAWEGEIESYLRSTFDDSYVAIFRSGGSTRTIPGMSENHRHLWSHLDARTTRLNEFLARIK